MNGLSKKIAQLISYDVDIAGCVLNNGRIPTLRHATNSDICNTKPIYTPENIISSIHPADRENFLSELKPLHTTTHNTDILKHPNCRLKVAKGNYRKFDLTIRPSSMYPEIVHPILTGTDKTAYYTINQYEEIINRVLRHDIRNKINVIQGNANIITEETSETPTKKANNINQAAENISNIVEDVRYIKKRLKDTDTKLIQRDLNNVITSEIEPIKNKHPNITIHNNVSSREIIGSYYLNNAITELLQNAIKHSNRPTTELTIQIEESQTPSEPLTKIKIIDNGEGINPPEYKPIISGKETNLHHASGLGLWTVKWIIESIYGNFSISRREDTEGTVATIELQKWDAETQSKKHLPNTVDTNVLQTSQ